jgi:indolepyruvate ferredoxin oxidoreductase alpha subunit
MVWPLPKKLLTKFFKTVEKVIIVEQLDPFLETEIRAMGFKVSHGKDVIPNIFELSPEIVEKSLKGKRYRPPKERVPMGDLPKRPPNMCPGCSHRALFYTLKKLKLFVFGDIGCYTLATAPPLNALHSCICMGAGIGGALGASKVLGKEGLGKSCAVLGDSTFLHAGIGPLMDVVYNKGNSTTLILDNRTTGMTGLQEHAGTGYTITGESTHSVDFEALCKSLGVQHVRKVDPYNLKETMDVVKEEVERDAPSVIITTNGPCMLHRRERRKFDHPFYAIDADKCRGCTMCLEVGCPAISWKEVSGDQATTKDGHKRKGMVSINRLMCPGCGLCSQICKFEAIVPGTV